MTENCSHFKAIKYVELTAKQKELFNFQKIAAALADYGYNCIKLADDWQGADFLAYHRDNANTLKVQLKSRLTIHAKYQEKGIWIAFPYKDSWYLIDHDRLVDKVGEHTDWLETVAWKDNHGYQVSLKTGSSPSTSLFPLSKISTASSNSGLTFARFIFRACARS
jgi:hypothetical protein